ncbi:MAG TPA: heavy metal-associated domain-containing protein [Egibacteraceae bacterium]|nr:heavy metal-associated domain-containing protein [Egibacteraceae bacterium]
MVVVNVPHMQCRHDVRSISARVADIAGVMVLQVDLATKTVHVDGDVSADAVRAAIAAAGYCVTE